MGLFDRVWVPCPKCGEKADFQSKAGDPDLRDYTLDDAPPATIAYFVDYPWSEKCQKCGTRFRIDVSVSATVNEVEE